VRIRGYSFFEKVQEQPTTPVISLDDLNQPVMYQGQQSQSPWENSIFDGGKFAGGFGPTQLQEIDYWTLRKRSGQLFNENLYARGLIRRLISNEINTGLTPEAFPDEEILGLKEDSLNNWTENVEKRFAIWGKNPKVCDWKHSKTFGALQKEIRREALVSGDVLVVLRVNPVTKLPLVQVVSGDSVSTPFEDDVKLRTGHKIKHGVEFNTLGRVAAHWVKQEDGTHRRIAAFGERSGRKLSWLVYGTEKRLDEVRGQPLLAIVLQSLKEVDRYRDAVQRKAALNAILAMFIKKTEDKMSTLPISGGAVTKNTVVATDTSTGSSRNFNIASQIPGVVMEELQTGEEPVGFNNQGTDSSFGEFEQAIIQGVAWANEIPPEILTLAFSSNYSASQAAISEFKIYLNKIWAEFGDDLCAPVYNEWLISETLTKQISSPGLLEAWRDPNQYDIFGAWVSADWYGSIKPSIDILKQVKGSKMLIAEGLSTHSRESRITTGTKFSRNIKRLKQENQLKVDAMRPLAEFNSEFAINNDEAVKMQDELDDLLEAKVHEYIDDAQADSSPIT